MIDPIFLESGQLKTIEHSRPLLYSGSSNIAVDGTTPKEFSFTPATKFRIHAVQICMFGGAFDGSKWADLAAALTNGVKLYIESGGSCRFDFFDVD